MQAQLRLSTSSVCHPQKHVYCSGRCKITAAQPAPALLPGSPAINTGDPAFAPPSYDQRGAGFNRVGNGHTDIGAFELQSAARPIYSSAPAAPGPISITGPPGSPASTSIAVTNIGDPRTNLDVLTANASAGFAVTPAYWYMTLLGLTLIGLGIQLFRVAGKLRGRARDNCFYISRPNVIVPLP